MIGTGRIGLVSRLALLGIVAVSASCGHDSRPLPRRCAVPVGESPVRGPADAWVTLVEFGDFQCPFCGAVVPTLHEVDLQRPGLRWVFKHFPLPFHPRSLPASMAAECAKEQDRFWDMYDTLFAHQSALEDADLAAYAEGIGLDLVSWQACLASATPAAQIAADRELGQSVDLTGTPTFFINGSPLVGARPSQDFLDAIDSACQSAESSGVPAAQYYADLANQGCH